MLDNACTLLYARQAPKIGPTGAKSRAVNPMEVPKPNAPGIDSPAAKVAEISTPILDPSGPWPDKEVPDRVARFYVA